jgi:hypothetical protein
MFVVKVNHTKTNLLEAVLVFHREVEKNFTHLSCYVASNGNVLQTFQDNLSVPYSGMKILRNNPEERSFQIY